MERIDVTSKEVSEFIQVRSKGPSELVKKIHSNLALPSYVHGYSLAIQFMRDWFISKFEKDYFNTIFVEGRHVLDDYKKFYKQIIKGKNPRLRIEPRVQYDFDRDTIDSYMAPPELYLRKSTYNESFFKDYDRDLFLGLQMRSLRMDFNFKIRVDSRAKQLDLYNRMMLYFRIGSTMHENLSIDFHIPKSIMLNIADRAGFEIKNGEIVDIIEFLNYANSHSDLPFLFKIRAINQKAEFFIRMKELYTHISCIDKPQLDDGERDGKLDNNFHIEMNCILTIPIPHFYAYYSAKDLTVGIETKEMNEGCVAIYSINAFEIPNVDENGWTRAAITDFMTDKGDTEMDLSSIFNGDNSLARAIKHDLTRGISPYHFINVQVYRGEDVAKDVPVQMDWNTKIAHFKEPQPEEVYHIAIYYDRNYINTLDIELDNYNKNRIGRKDK